MIFPSYGSIQVLEPASGALVGMDLDALLEELRCAFRRCAIQEEWLAENLLSVLRERLREDSADGVCSTSHEIRRMLVRVLYASGFSDVAQSFIENAPREASADDAEFPVDLRSWSRENLEAFLQNQPEIPPEAIPELLLRLPPMLSGTGFAGASETLVLELARHLVHFSQHENLSPASVTVTAPIRYITRDDWSLPLDEAGHAMLAQGVVVLQPVSDILPVAVVQCHLMRLFDGAGDAPADASAFLARMESVSAFLLQCLVLMRGQMSSRWPDVQFSGAVVRMMGFSGILKIFTSARHRKERRALGQRLEEALRRNFSESSIPVVVRFS